MARNKSVNVSISEDTNEKLFATITEEPYVPYKITDKMYKDLDNAHRALEKKKITPYQLKTLINKYPHVPTFYNYLSVAYQDTNQPDKVLPVIKTLIKKFPYYFHAQFNLISHYLETNDDAALDTYFENIKSIQDVAPKKEEFHVSEFIGFYSAFSEYLEKKKDEEKIQRILKMLKNIKPYFPDVKIVIENVSIILERVRIMKKVEQKAKDENAQVIHLKVKDEE